MVDVNITIIKLEMFLKQTVYGYDTYDFIIKFSDQEFGGGPKILNKILSLAHPFVFSVYSN